MSSSLHNQDISSVALAVGILDGGEIMAWGGPLMPTCLLSLTKTV